MFKSPAALINVNPLGLLLAAALFAALCIFLFVRARRWWRGSDGAFRVPPPPDARAGLPGLDEEWSAATLERSRLGGARVLRDTSLAERYRETAGGRILPLVEGGFAAGSPAGRETAARLARRPPDDAPDEEGGWVDPD